MKKDFDCVDDQQPGGFAAFGQDTAKEDLKKSGQDVKASRQRHREGHESMRRKGVKKGTKKAVHKAASATEKGADKVKDKTK